MKVLVAQSYPTLGNPMDCSLLGFSVHWILQARILEWVAIPFSRGSSQPRDQTRVSHITGRFFTIWVTRIFLILINWLSAGNLDVFFKKGFLSVWSLGKEMHLCDSSFLLQKKKVSSFSYSVKCIFSSWASPSIHLSFNTCEAQLLFISVK